MSSRISLIHLSDIHFQVAASGGQYDLDQDLRNELEIDAKSLREERGDVHGVLISGDIAFSGQKKEYETALIWLDHLCGALNCPSQNVWTTPGNHDVDRSVIEGSKLLRTIHRDLRETKPADLDEKIQEYMQDVEARELLYRPLKNYNDFASAFQCEVDPERPIWEHDIKLNDGSTLRLRGINSALISDNLDNEAANRLMVGNFQATPMTQAGVEYLILCHHPTSWLLDRDSLDDLWTVRTRIQTFGHKHSPRIRQVDQSLILAAGATHPDRREPSWRPSYNLIEVSVGGEGDARCLRVDVHPRKWNDIQKRFQADDELVGSASRTYQLSAGKWGLTTLPETSPADDELQETVEQTANETPSSEKGSESGFDTMDPGRRLTYRFLRLPYHTRLRVAQNLDLISDDDKGVRDAELFRRFFSRAQERSQLEALWNEVESAHGEDEVSTNPFEGT